MKKKIGYGVSLFNDVKVTSIGIDNWMHMIKFVCEKGTEVEVIDMTMEMAQYMGIINLEPLLKILQKNKR